MTNKPFYRLLLLGSVMFLTSMCALAALPTTWWVNGNGYTGLLVYTLNPQTQRISGTLLGTPVEGYLVGRHLVLHRHPAGNTQLWEGWILDRTLGSAIPSYSGDFIIAGTISVNGDQVYPWFGIEQGKNAGFTMGQPPSGAPGGLTGQAQVVAGTLHGLRWEMPCQVKGATCNAAVPRPVKSTILGGDPNRTYQVTLRFRGVVEQQSYAGGQQDGLWYTGGRSADGNYNIYKLEITSPPQTYFLNAGRAGIRRCWLIDYTRTITVRGGATVILSADAQDGRLIGNVDDQGRPIVVPGVPPAPQPYNGQFIQMDVIEVK